MPDDSKRYRESLLQWVWSRLHFDMRNLQTYNGDKLRIENPGILNNGSGPDFLNARFQIGNLLWHGHVEIHIDEEEWYRHGHHNNPEFDSTILHVFLNPGGRRAARSDGTFPYSLHLSAFLEAPLYQLLYQQQRNRQLPCSGHLNYISEEVFHRQILKAHREYFEYKVEELLEYYPANLPLGRAWKNMLITGIYRSLGIPGNTLPMSNLAKTVLGNPPRSDSMDQFARLVKEGIATFDSVDWTTTGIRPSSHPEKRVYQAACFHFLLEQLPVREAIHLKTDVWQMLLASLSKKSTPGPQMRDLVFATVFLPSLYLLGDLLFYDGLKEDSYQKWMNFNSRLPESIRKPFVRSGLPVKKGKGKLGLAHQLKRYCHNGRCHHCDLLKKAILS